MKIETYALSARKPEPEPVRLALQEAGDSVFLIAVDAYGERVEGGYLLQFKADGTIYRECGINPSLGFRLDGGGCIVLEDK